jgi:2-keto-3-deoxy-L-rhamnonate aldolase RhmA
MTLTVADRLNEGGAAFGITLTIVDPFLAEVIAAQPFDYLMVDAEHSPMSTYQLQTQLIALRTTKATILVRVADGNPTVIGEVLDLGAHGVVVPHIETREECANAVSAALYPPRGHRGIGPRRAARLTDRASYFRRANDDTLIVALIESAPGVENIDDILAVEGLGGVIIGAVDLSASLGHLNDPEHEDVVKAVDVIIERCNAAGVPFGMYAPSAAAAAKLLSRGARIISVGSDLIFFDQGMSAVLDAVRPVRDGHLDVAGL